MPNRTTKALALAAAAAAMLAMPSLAHTYLVDATPVAGANLAASPPEVVLNFTGELEPAFSNIVVTDEKDHVVDSGPSVATGKTMRVPLNPLKPGRYTVSWRAVSIDTHLSDGKYNFLVLP
ncbi:MAG: copper resistance CopC family protein [Rhizomicrobium sp.]